MRRRLLILGTLLVATAWFTWLRPTALGGDASYVVVQGRSMEPTYEDGDLVLVREDREYEHGDVIAFMATGSFDDSMRVIHRIVGDAGRGRFHTQGDNRDRPDSWTPGPDEIIGRAVLHLPMVGQAAGILTQPATFAALGGAAVVAGGEKRRRRRRHVVRRANDKEAGQLMSGKARSVPAVASRTTTRASRATHPRWAFTGLVLCALLAAPLMAVTWSALRAPDSTRRVEHVGELAYQIGVDYRFLGSPSAVYPDGIVRASQNAAGAVVPSDPLYSKLLDRLQVEIAFRANAQGAERVTSHYAIDVSVETPSGWSTVLDSLETTAFEGTATDSVDIDLRAVAMQLAAVAELTGVGGDAYTINVVPSLDVVGDTEVGEVEERLAAPISFVVENNVITANAIGASDTRDLTQLLTEQATYSVGPLDMGTQAARGVLGGLALVLVAGIAWFASVLFGGMGLGEPARIAARYRSQVVDVSGATAPPGPVVMVSAIDELARIAKVEQTVILHEDLGDGAHRYRVFLGTVTYEYETAPEHGGAATGVETTTEETG